MEDDRRRDPVQKGREEECFSSSAHLPGPFVFSLSRGWSFGFSTALGTRGRGKTCGERERVFSAGPSFPRLFLGPAPA